MKRILFSASIVALAASCTNELELQNMQQEQVKTGITFSAADAATDAATRGEYEEGDNVWYPFWTAETDLIKIYADKVKLNGDTWTHSAILNNRHAVYKATKSERFAQFVGLNPENIYDFKDDVDAENPATFIAVYPSTVIGLTNNVTPDWEEGFDFTLNTGAVSASQTQTNAKGQGIYNNNVKFAIAKGYPKADNQIAVGENVDLEFNRIHAGLVFSTKGINEYTENLSDVKGSYESIFGKLKSVTITAKGEGEIKDGKFVEKTDGNKSTLTANGSTTTVNVDKEGNVTYETTYNAPKGSEITIDMGTGVEWNDDARAYAIITPVTRFNGWNEFIEVKYKFENIEFTNYLQTKNNWEAGKFYSVPAIDMSNYDYYVTGTTSNYTLVLKNSADFNEIYNPATKTIAWGDDQVSVTNIKAIISNVKLTDQQLTLIGKDFTALTDVELNEQVNIPADAFKNIAGKLTRLVLPKVTTIDKDFSGKIELDKLVELNLASYTFPNTEINNMLFNGMASKNNAVLKNVNIKGVKDMTAEFNVNRTISFEGFTALEKVEMGENVIVAPKAFKGCIKLRSVTGTLDLGTKNAVEAFYQAGQGTTPYNRYDLKNPDKYFSTVNLSNTEIPASAFAGATAMHDILKDGKQIVPTYIGKGAFENAYSLEYMDLSQAETINENAFKGAGEYKGAAKDVKRLDVGAKTIETSIFEGTQVVNVYFTEATELNGPAFTGCSKLEQIEFAKDFTAKAIVTSDGSLWLNGFGNSSSVELFIQPDNKYYDRDNTKIELTLPYKTSDTDSKIEDKAVPFKNITVRK